MFYEIFTVSPPYPQALFLWIQSSTDRKYLEQVLRAGALGRPKGMGWGGRWEGDQDGEYM